MLSLASWLAAQRARRVVFIAGLFPLPILGLLSAATVVMSAQLKGPREAPIDCGLALLLLSGMAWFADMDAPLLVSSAGVSWLILAALGTLAGRFGSLQLAIQAGILLALAALVTLFLAGEGVTAYWTEVLETLYRDLAEQGVAIEVDVAAQAALMSGLVIAGSFAGIVLAVLLGSSWASGLLGGNYAKQFRQLRLGYVVGGLAALVGLAEVLGLETGGALLIFGTAFMFHGMAVIAWWAGILAWPRGWWIGLCILLLLIPNLLIVGLVVFATIGFIDNWYSLRRKPA
jgi:hypothetical protein